jgi:hypothetical protein
MLSMFSVRKFLFYIASILQAEVRQNVATQLNRWISIGFLPRYRASQFLTILDDNEHRRVLRFILIKPNKPPCDPTKPLRATLLTFLLIAMQARRFWARATPT